MASRCSGRQTLLLSTTPTHSLSDNDELVPGIREEFAIRCRCMLSCYAHLVTVGLVGLATNLTVGKKKNNTFKVQLHLISEDYQVYYAMEVYPEQFPSSYINSITS